MEKYTFKLNSIEDIQFGIAKRLKLRRLEKNLTQREFAKRAGIGYDAYRSFETSGDSSVKNLILCAFVLGDEDVLDSIFARTSYQSIDELVHTEETIYRQRASKK